MNPIQTDSVIREKRLSFHADETLHNFILGLAIPANVLPLIRPADHLLPDSGRRV